MVTRWRARLRDSGGKSRVGCLASVLVAAVVVYYGVDVGAVYLRHWQLVQEMKSLARLAPGLDDATIRRRLHAKADALDLPPSARQVTVRRFSRPREIRISTSYEATVNLPFTQYTFRFRPEARAPL